MPEWLRFGEYPVSYIPQKKILDGYSPNDHMINGMLLENI